MSASRYDLSPAEAEVKKSIGDWAVKTYGQHPYINEEFLWRFITNATVDISQQLQKAIGPNQDGALYTLKQVFMYYVSQSLKMDQLFDHVNKGLEKLGDKFLKAEYEKYFPEVKAVSFRGSVIKGAESKESIILAFLKKRPLENDDLENPRKQKRLSLSGAVEKKDIQEGKTGVFVQAVKDSQFLEEIKTPFKKL